jgi:hypothetical protein
MVWLMYRSYAAALPDPGRAVKPTSSNDARARQGLQLILSAASNGLLNRQAPRDVRADGAGPRYGTTARRPCPPP